MASEGSSLTNSPVARAILNVVEPVVFGRPAITLFVLVALTLFFGYHAAKIQPDAGYEKTIPMEHPYMGAFQEYYSEFGGANLVLVALMQTDGEIYNEKFLSTLKQVTDDVFFLPNIDRPRVMSLFTPNVRFVEITEQGFEGGDVIPSDYAPSEPMY